MPGVNRRRRPAGKCRVDPRGVPLSLLLSPCLFFPSLFLWFYWSAAESSVFNPLPAACPSLPHTTLPALFCLYLHPSHPVPPFLTLTCLACPPFSFLIPLPPYHILPQTIPVSPYPSLYFSFSFLPYNTLFLSYLPYSKLLLSCVLSFPKLSPPTCPKPILPFYVFPHTSPVLPPHLSCLPCLALPHINLGLLHTTSLRCFALHLSLT